MSTSNPEGPHSGKPREGSGIFDLPGPAREARGPGYTYVTGAHQGY